jgi:hypothetical protein
LEDQEVLLDAISNELRENSDESGLRSVLQLLAPALWPRLSEPARLRSENRIVNNLRDGRYSSAKGQCVGGALATWSTDFWPHFALKREILATLAEKVRSQDVQQLNYVVRFHFSSLETLAPKPPTALEKGVIAALKRGDDAVKEALDRLMLFGSWEWSKDVSEALTSFQKADPFSDDSDDLPF